MPTGRIMLIAGAVSLGALSAPVYAQGSLPDQLATCARIGKKDARLECYDSIARAAGQGNYTSSFGLPSSAAPATPPAPGAPTGFGAEQVARPVSERAAESGQDELSATVSSARDNGLGMWQVGLSDGATWRMTERVANFRPPAPNESVTIRKGALGSYLMQVGRQAAVRVARVR